MSTLSLCRRAGKLVMGFDAVAQELQKRKSAVAGVILANDVSEKTAKEIRFFSERQGKEVVQADFTMDEVNTALNKRCGVFAVTDEGLFGSIKKADTEYKQSKGSINAPQKAAATNSLEE